MTIHNETDNFLQEYNNAAENDASQSYHEKMAYLEPYIHGDLHAYEEYQHSTQYSQELHHHYPQHPHSYPAYYNNGHPGLHFSLPDVLPQFPTPAPTRGCSPHVYGGFLDPMAHTPNQHMTSGHYDMMGSYTHPSSQSLTLNYFQPSIAPKQSQDCRSNLSALAPPVAVKQEKDDDAEFVADNLPAEDSDDGDSSSSQNYDPKPKAQRKSLDKTTKPHKANKAAKPRKSKVSLPPNNINTIIEENMLFPGDAIFIDSSFGPVIKRRRSQVKIACIHCKKACKKCDEVRPCDRCVRTGNAETCVDAPRKERMKGFKRGVYSKNSSRRTSTDSNNIADQSGVGGGDYGSDNEKIRNERNYIDHYKEYIHPSSLCIPEHHFAAEAAEFSPEHFQEDIPAYENYTLLTGTDNNASDGSEDNDISSPYIAPF